MRTLEDCELCRRWAPDVKTGRDVPRAYLSDGAGGRYHDACVERYILPALARNPLALAELREASEMVERLNGDEGRRH